LRGELKKTVEKRSDKDDKRFADFFQIIGRPGYSSEDSDVEKCGSVDETSTPYSLNRNEKVSSQRGDQTCTLVSLTAGSPIRLTVTKQEYVIGKSTEQADGVAGFSKMISRRHCKIVKRGSGYAVVDLNSSNGTYLNGMQLFPGREYPVKNGDIIRMAISDFQIVME
ncbi:MAG: FHA domain-containing protein, partial [[Ruminococcus] torques]